VLEVAPTATPGVGVFARRRYPFRARFENLHRVGARERGRRFVDPHPHEFTGQAVANENHSPVGQPADPAPGGWSLDANRARFVHGRGSTHWASLLTPLPHLSDAVVKIEVRAS
jgi:hypothetical protein